MKFEVGDKITALASCKKYNVTDQNAVVKVIKVLRGSFIKVEVIEHTEKNFIGSKFDVDEKYFKKVGDSSIKPKTIMGDNQPVYWENRTNGSNKFWAAHIIEEDIKITTPTAGVLPKRYILVRKWGKIGTRGQTLRHSYNDVYTAKEALAKLIWAKESKGYVSIF